MAAQNAPDLMDRIYRSQRHIYNATRKYYLLGRDRLIRDLQPPAAGRVLEIGCGTGRNLILAARLYPQAQFFGIDISREMLTVAERALLRRGLAQRVSIAQADATRFAPQPLFGQATFDRIFISYSLSMIPDWRTVMEQAIDLLSPGGELHVVDFGDQAGLPSWFRHGLRRWLKQFHVTPRDDFEAALRRLAVARNASIRIARPYRGYAQMGVLRTPVAVAPGAASTRVAPHRVAAL